MTDLRSEATERADHVATIRNLNAMVAMISELYRAIAKERNEYRRQRDEYREYYLYLLKEQEKWLKSTPPAPQPACTCEYSREMDGEGIVQITREQGPWCPVHGTQARMDDVPPRYERP